MTTPPPAGKNPGGRPTKLTEEFMAAMMEVLNDEDNALIYSDFELLDLVNDKLPLEERVHGDTFSLWKNGHIADDQRAVKFFSVYKKALMRQKRSLFRKLDDPQNPHWQKEAWKIERKFDDWNIKQKISVAKLPEDGAAALAAALLGADNPASDGSPPDVGPKTTDALTDAPGV